ncbi:MAG TPA: ribonuclease HII [Patescibacteria group bacterium]|nr:ribonuclease HII [Patescibacteria group bacterium]
MIIPDLSFEKQLWQKGYLNVAGVDEAGRGPWAGPVTAGAVVIHSAKQVVPIVRDSKKMTARQREKAFLVIREESSAFGVGIVSAEEINKIGINRAAQKAMLLALSEIENKFHLPISFVIIDGSRTLRLAEYRSERIKAGGLYHYSIAAGSVLAKVTRDRIMKKLASQYPQYGFEKHVGYGTKEHLEALKKFGPCPIHRQNYKPIKNLKENIKVIC